MTWLPDLSSARGPLYRAIADALASDVASGRLRGGERLPPQRDLARGLGVDLTTVSRAFAAAASAGLTVSEGRRGTFVRERPGSQGEIPANEAASGMNMPPESEDGAFRRRYAEGVAALLKGNDAPLHYQPAGGTEEQRAAAALLLSALVPETKADQCVVTSGSQHSLHAVIALTVRPGDRVAAAGHAYPGFLATARRLGISLVPLAADGDGIVPEALEEAAARAPLRAVYVVPTNDNPTTATLPPARRRRIAAIARKFDFTILEDDAYGRLPERPVAPLAALAPERTWHLVTMSKLLSPSLRVGFVRAPTVRDALALSAAVHETAGMPPPVNATLVARWIEDGTFARLLAGVRAEARARMEEAAELLAPLGARGHREGYHLWLPLAPDANADRIAAQAVAAGLPAVASSAFATGPETDVQALRVSLGGSAQRWRVRREIARLEALVAQVSRGSIV